MMNDSERTIMGYVNRAQLAINDWQCSGEIYYLEQAKAELAEAVFLADELAKEKPVFLQYSAEVQGRVGSSYLCDTPEEALEDIRTDLIVGDLVIVYKQKESQWQPYIDMDDLIEGFISQADDEAGEGAEAWCDFISGNALAQARKELDEQLNDVLEAWLRKHKVEAGWYDRAGIEGTYRFCGDKFIRVSKAGDDA